MSLERYLRPPSVRPSITYNPLSHPLSPTQQKHISPDSPSVPRSLAYHYLLDSISPGTHQHHNITTSHSPTMTSKFTEILEPSDAPTYTHPHLNVSLEDILAEEGRKRSASQSSVSSQSSNPRSGSNSPVSPTTEESKKEGLRRRAFTFGSKKVRRGT